jgi:spore maturation protein CgeB
MSHVRALRSAGVHNAGYLQIGFDEEQYRPAPTTWSGETGLYDVSFLGSAYKGTDEFSRDFKFHHGDLRTRTVVALRDAFGDKFGLFGNGWDNIVKPIPLHRAHEVYWRSKMSVNISLANWLDCYSSDRIFRILGCGSALLTARFEGMGTYGLVDGENCLVFDTPEDAVGIAQAYISALDPSAAVVDGEAVGLLVNGKPASAIAAAGAKLAAEHHTGDVRMQELAALVDAVRGAWKHG